MIKNIGTDNKLNKFYQLRNFLKIPKTEIKQITKEMKIEKGNRENLFTCFLCINNNIPLIIVGNPA